MSGNASIMPYSCQLLWVHHIIHHLHLYSSYILATAVELIEKFFRFTFSSFYVQKRLFPQKLLNVSNTTLDIYVQGQCAVKITIIFPRHLLMGLSLTVWYLKWDIFLANGILVSFLLKKYIVNGRFLNTLVNYINLISRTKMILKIDWIASK